MSSKINLQTCEYACKSSIFQDNQLILNKNLTNNAITGLVIDTFDIIIDEAIIHPICGLGEECSAFISEKGIQKLKLILTGLKTILSDEQWNGMKMEFDIRCVLSSKNAFNEKTRVEFITSANVVNEKEKQGKLSYKIYNYDYKVLNFPSTNC